MEAEGGPGWLRAAYIILGILAIILGILVIAFPSLGEFLLLVLFGIGLIFIAIFAILLGAQSGYPGWLRALSLIIGVLVIALIITIIFVPEVGLFIQILLLGIGLILLGIQSIAFIGTDTSLAGWARGVAVVLGALALILGIVMIVQYDVGITVLVIYFAIGLFATGIAAIVAGSAG